MTVLRRVEHDLPDVRQAYADAERRDVTRVIVRRGPEL
jgi:hypothetical protein